MYDFHLFEKFRIEINATEREHSECMSIVTFYQNTLSANLRESEREREEAIIRLTKGDAKRKCVSVRITYTLPFNVQCT